jgi:hypothetical protein
MNITSAGFVAVLVMAASCAGVQTAGGAGPAGGGRGTALMVVGTIPLVGTDVQIREALQARNLEVEEILEVNATPRSAEGKRVVVLSFSMLSTSFKADLADLPVPLIVMEHNLLPRLAMTSAAGHGYQPGLTQLAITSDDAVLTAGLPRGDVAVHLEEQQMFWGTPGPGAIKVAAATGHPEQTVIFAYPAGAEMVGKVAPARRLHFFFAVHAPPPVTKLYLNDNGLKLLGSSIDWSLQ